MWPFNRKQKEADEIWRTLQGRAPDDAMEQLVISIANGDTKKAEELFGQIMRDKIRQVHEDNIKD